MKMRDYLLIPVALVGVYLMHKSDNNDESFLKGITPHKDYSVTVNLDSVDVKKNDDFARNSLELMFKVMKSTGESFQKEKNDEIYIYNGWDGKKYGIQEQIFNKYLKDKYGVTTLNFNGARKEVAGIITDELTGIEKKIQ